MSLKQLTEDLSAAFHRTTYFKWAKQEGIPLIEAYGFEDVRDVQLAPWARLGGRGAFVQLYGMMEGSRSMYVAEIPPGGALEPERHLYEELICVLQGHGATEIWQDGGRKQLFEWGPWSLFSPPLNTWHRLVNGGREPVRVLGTTNAPLIMNAFRDSEFIFKCPYAFSNRYQGEQDFFAVGTKRYKSSDRPTNVWETNFIPSLKEAGLDAQEQKGSGVRITQFEMSGNTLIGHLSEWPAGRYHKAHYHGPGALLLGLESKGYVLMWSKDFTTQPYSKGQEDGVVEMEWKEGSVYSPLDGWFHQHFNTGPRSARHLAVRYGGERGHTDLGTSARLSRGATLTDMKEGGTLIEYKDEDPEIRRRFEEALKKVGVRCEMPPVP
jgi:oxalate decarboxylase/phosphoglucose isomerase-like protein (cupin superfamily)